MYVHWMCYVKYFEILRVISLDYYVCVGIQINIKIYIKITRYLL